MPTRADAEALDAADELAHWREKFALPDGVYLDGNSLGVMPKATPAVVQEVTQEQWGRDLISSWNKHSWVTLQQRIGGKIASFIGAEADEVVATDSTSLNVFKTVSAALDLRPDRSVIISERGNFPTDLYMLEGLIKARGGRHKLVLLDEPAEEINEDSDLSDVAVVLLTHVSYRSGRMLDMKKITNIVHNKGAIMVWDLAHSAGAVPVDLNAAQADFAVGCGYKYLNGGPGAPAFLYVARRHQEVAQNPLSGWFGHAAAFAFETSYRPAAGIQRFLCGTPSAIALSALEVGVDIMAQADMAALRRKSIALSELFLQLLQQDCGRFGFRVFSPLDPNVRGSQVNICHEQGYAIVQALAARGVTGDFRTPDIMRFGFTPLYTSHVDVWEAVQHLRQVMEGAEWDCPGFRSRNTVT